MRARDRGERASEREREREGDCCKEIWNVSDLQTVHAINNRPTFMLVTFSFSQECPGELQISVLAIKNWHNHMRKTSHVFHSRLHGGCIPILSVYTSPPNPNENPYGMDRYAYTDAFTWAFLYWMSIHSEWKWYKPVHVNVATDAAEGMAPKYLQNLIQP